MSQIAFQTIVIATVGEAGAAVGSEESIPIHGFLLDVFLDYNAAAPATTDVTISEETFGNIVVKSDNATDAWLAPRMPTVDAAGAATGMFDLVPLDGPVTISVAQADELSPCVTATLRWMTA